jgi:16S rRNA (guanine527-N7)-methyltransferase
MHEDEAKAWLIRAFGAEACERLAMLVALVTEENSRQNLIAPSTVPQIWSRHVADSAQLLAHAPETGSWLDIGTGGGFPGLVIAILRPQAITLVEPRRRRAEFLQRCVTVLRLPHVNVEARSVEAVRQEAGVISARAVATVEKLLLVARHCSTTATRWLLPRGRIDACELQQIAERWTGVFHVEQSLTDDRSSILVIHGLGKR